MLSSPTKDTWIFASEAMAIWSKARGSLDYAIWGDRIRARQSAVGAVWMVEYNSCLKFWGSPKNSNVNQLVLRSVQDA